MADEQNRNRELRKKIRAPKTDPSADANDERKKKKAMQGEIDSLIAKILEESLTNM